MKRWKQFAGMATRLVHENPLHLTFEPDWVMIQQACLIEIAMEF